MHRRAILKHCYSSRVASGLRAKVPEWLQFLFTKKKNRAKLCQKTMLKLGSPNSALPWLKAVPGTVFFPAEWLYIGQPVA